MADKAQKTDNKAKNVAIQTALLQISKNFGQGTVMKLGEVQNIAIERIPTGSLSLDIALGGGLPRGRVVEIFGPESSGKTTVCLHAIAESQRLGGQCAFIDAEHALDPEYANKIGVDTDNLLISQPDSGEQALAIVETLVNSNALDIVVVDSVAALTPKAEIEGEMGDSHMGLQARLMSQALRKLTSIVSKSKTTVIFINQIRMKIGIMFGNPETTSGGNALKFYSSVRMDIRSAGKIDVGAGDQKEIVGMHARVKVVKNKTAPPFRMAMFDIMYDEGISFAGDVLDLAVRKDIVSKSGAFYNFGELRLGQGRENAKAFLKGNKKVLDQIVKAIRNIKEE
jgi:recombination protein RecA